MRKMGAPQSPKVNEYGLLEVGAAHDIQMFPAILRRARKNDSALVEPISSALFNDGATSSCFFHTDRPVSSVCDVSGRLICELCTTEYEGKTVSFEAFSKLVQVKSKAGKKEKKGSFIRPRRITFIKWDDVAVSLAVLPMLFVFVTIITAPIVLVITAQHWKEGPTSPVRRTRIRYVFAVICALLQIAGWGMFMLAHFSGEVL